MHYRSSAAVSFLASALAVLVVIGRLPAQPVPQECSGEELVILEAILDRHLDLFTSEKSAGFRQRNNLMQLPADIDREVIANKNTCKRVVKEALHVLDTQFSPPGTRTHHAAVRTTVLRYGPYYVVLIEPPPPPPEVDLAMQGFADIIILSVDTLEFLGWILG